MTSSQSPATSADTPAPPRVLSIDIFRGLTMAVMIFVNALSSARGLPWWTYHAHAEEDVMTYVDMVYPFFLFIVGMSMPLAILRRLERDGSQLRLWAHIALRSASLIVLGLILANAGRGDAAQMGLSRHLWALLAVLSAALYLNSYPKGSRIASVFPFLRYGGLIATAVLLAIFRAGASSGQPTWIDFSYPEILGLIGFTYFAAAILYVPTRRWPWAPFVWFVLLIALCALSTANVIRFPGNLPLLLWPFGNGAMCCLVLAGIVTSSIFFSNGRPRELQRSMSLAAGFALLALVAGFALAPLGISKIRATPTWSLWSVAAAVPAFMLLYWLCDIKGCTRWAFFVRPAGSNTLLTYLLPDVWYFLSALLSISAFDLYFTIGWPAVVKTIAFTLLMLAISGALTKAKLRLQL